MHISLHDSVVINSTSGSDIHDGRVEVVFFYSVWSHNTSEYSQRGAGLAIRDRGSDLYVGIDMVKNYCLYKWYGRCSAMKGQKLSQITPN